MSLVIGVVQKDFIIASSDSAVTIWGHDESEYERTGKFVKTGEVINTGIKSEKVYKITDKVLLTTTGSIIATALIKSELKYFIREEHTLKQCGEIAKRVISNINKGIFYNKQDFYKTLTDKYLMTETMLSEMKEHLFSYMYDLLPKNNSNQDGITGYQMYLLGFNEDGTTGLINVLNGEQINGPVDIKNGYPVILNGPKGYEYLQFMNLPIKDRSLKGFSDRMTLIHARISKDNPINVSTDCNYHVFIRDKENVVYDKFTIDTAELQKTFN